MRVGDGRDDRQAEAAAAFAGTGGAGEALEGAVEHEVVDRLMEDLSRSRSIGSDKWTARCTVLQELLEHHIDEEEGEFFKIARKIFDRETLAKMGMAFMAEKTSLRVP